MNLRRRQLLLGGALALGFPRLITARSASDYPFTLGVASGEPDAQGFVIWTRLAPKPLDGGGMSSRVVSVDWEVADDEQFQHIARRGSAEARPAWAHSVHVEVDGLQPGRWYWYRFRAGGEWSPAGRSRTSPPAGAGTPLHFGFVSCQHYEDGYYAAYRHLLAQQPELIVHLGDYIYESNIDQPVRPHGNPVPKTLEQYRNRHAVYKLDVDLQRAHAACPWLLTWDDHDVQNDYAGEYAPDLAPRAQFLARRTAAYQAWYEHMPVRAAARPRQGRPRLYRVVDLGGLARFYMLDTRQYRSDQPCGDGRYGGGAIVENCDERLQPERTMFGKKQEAWLAQSLAHSPARWNVIAQSLLMARLDQRPGPAVGYWSDGWDAYPAARQRLLDRLQQHRVANPVVIGGDIHSFWANDLLQDFSRPDSPVVASELVGSSISSRGVPYASFKAMLPDNPHVHYFESRRRGYVWCELDQGGLRADFRGLEDVIDPASSIETLAQFAIESGRPGIQKA